MAEHSTMPHPNTPDVVRIPRPRSDSHDTFHDPYAAPDTDPADARTGPADPPEKLQFVVIGLDENIRAQAFEAANAFINEKTQGEGFMGLLKNFYNPKEAAKHLGEAGRQMWYGNIAREFHLMREAQKAKAKILDEQNLLANEGGSSTLYQEALFRRFGKAADIYEGLIREKAGEKRTRLSMDTLEDGSPDPEGAAIQEKFKELAARNLRGEFATRDDFSEAEKAMIAELVKTNPKAAEYLGRGQLNISNLYDITETLKASAGLEALDEAERKAAIQDILAESEVVLGEGRTGVRGGVERSRGEKIADTLSQVPFLNETALYTAVGVVISATGWTAKTVLGKGGMLLTAAVTGGLSVAVGAGAVAGLRAGRAFRQERNLHEREMASGKYSADDLEGRRAEMEKTRYNTKSAQDILEQIGLLYDGAGELRLHDPKGMLSIIADLEARLNLSDELDKNLISFEIEGASAKEIRERIDSQRTNLIVTLAKVKADLDGYLKNASDTELTDLGVHPSQFDEVRDAEFPADYILAPAIAGQEVIVGFNSGKIIEDLAADIAQKDALAHRMKGKEMGKAFLLGTLLGSAGTILTQEVVAGVSGSQQGVFERNASGNKNTVLHELFRGKHDSKTFSISGEYQGQAGGATTLNLPHSFSMHQEANGRFSMTGPNGVKVENLEFTKNGTLTDASHQELNKHGVSFGLTPETVVQETTLVDTEMGAADWHAHNQDITTEVTRQWQYNGTPGLPDQNEIRLDNPYYDKTTGTIVINMGRMTENGSFDANSAVNWKSPNSNIKMAFTLGDHTLSKTVLVDVDSHGRAVIPPDHPLYAQFHQTGHGNELKYDGKWVQAVNDKGPNASGKHVLEVMATDVNRHPETEFITTTIERQEVPNYRYNFTYHGPNSTTPAPDGGPDSPILVPVGPPMYGRRGLNTPKATNTNPTQPIAPPAPGPTAPSAPPPGSSNPGNNPSPGHPNTGNPSPPNAPGNPGNPGPSPNTANNGPETSPPPAANIPPPGSGNPTGPETTTTEEPAPSPDADTTREEAEAAAAAEAVRTKAEEKARQRDHAKAETPDDTTADDTEAKKATTDAAAAAAAAEFLENLRQAAEAKQKRDNEAAAAAEKTRQTEQEEADRKKAARDQWATTAETILKGNTQASFPFKTPTDPVGRPVSFPPQTARSATEAIRLATEKLSDERRDNLESDIPLIRLKARLFTINRAVMLVHSDIERGLSDAQKAALSTVTQFLNGSRDAINRDIERIKAKAKEVTAKIERMRNHFSYLADPRLTQQQILYLDRNSEAFSDLIKDFEGVHPGTRQYNELAAELDDFIKQFDRYAA